MNEYFFRVLGLSTVAASNGALATAEWFTGDEGWAIAFASCAVLMCLVAAKVGAEDRAHPAGKGDNTSERKEDR